MSRYAAFTVDRRADYYTRAADSRAADPDCWQSRYLRGLAVIAEVSRRRGIAARCASIDRVLLLRQTNVVALRAAR